MNQENIGKFISELRKEKNMTKQELADKLGVTDRAISNWENGRRLPDLPILTKNMLTFCCTAPLLPLSFLLSKILKIQFQDNSNPLNKLGILFSVNQMIYLLIAMWIYPTLSDKMLMVIAMIFVAHLLPFGWLYNSKTYIGLSVIIPILALIVGQTCENYILAIMMLILEIIFSILLFIENKKYY